MEEMKDHRWKRIFIGGVDNLYLTPVLVWSKEYRIFSLIWLKYKMGVVI